MFFWARARLPAVRKAKGSAAGTVKIDMRDFGPIRRGSMDLMPMTVLLGPNNSGKSYAALLACSVLGGRRGSAPSGHRKARRVAAKPNADGGAPVRDDIVEDLVGELCGRFQERIMDGIKSAFPGDPASLIRFGAERCTVRMQTGRITARIRISKGRCACRVEPSAKPRIWLSRVRNGGLTYRAEGSSIFINAPRSGSGPDSIASAVRDYLEPEAAFYIPAARSGILQVHEAISASIIGHAPYAGLGEAGLKLPGPVADLVADVTETPTRRGPFYGVASDLEKEILQGRVETGRRLASGIRYTHKRHSMPIHRASSTVYEMAPLVLYLKHAIRKKSTLIIEEPEAHLHPRNQAALAKYLAKLVRLGSESSCPRKAHSYWTS